MSDAPPSQPAVVAAPAELDISGRFPLYVMFLSAAVWVVVASAFALIASIKFHSPAFLADSAKLTYGHVHAAYLNCLIYGFCIQAGLGVALWLLARLGRTRLALPGTVFIGAVLWNVGVMCGVAGILWGANTGFEYLDLPGFTAWFLMPGYLLIGLAGVLTFQRRRERPLFVSQWFIFAALFWFPWIYATAELLLVSFPVRGATQVAVLAYYQANLAVIWLPLMGLAASFYFIPKLTQRDLHSGYLGLFVFWVLILVGGWTGISAGAPLPAWMPAISFMAALLLIPPVLGVALNVHRTLEGKWGRLWKSVPLQFIGVGTIALLLAWLMRIAIVGVDLSYEVALTWATPAQQELNQYAFFCLVMFGAIYAIVPRLTQTGFPAPRLVRLHFWLALLGVLLLIVPLAIAGAVQARQMQNPDIAFVAIMKSTLPYLRVSTLGIALLALGHLLFLYNLVALAVRFSRPRAVAAYAGATTVLTPAEVKA
jgi:cytochrome c oxidase cbb3-type subunit I